MRQRTYGGVRGRSRDRSLYSIPPSRSAAVASQLLGDFKGYLQSDGYPGYQRVSKDSKGMIKNLACWAHARRKFIEIDKISTKPGVAAEVVKRLAALYGIEKKARESGLTFEEIKAVRAEKSRPLLDELKKFLEDKQRLAPPKSSIGQAISYTLKLWDELTVYLEDGSLSIDNNGIERCIRPFAVGRKNWLFKGSVKGANAGAAIYSLLETAKSYDLNPFDYFEDILKKIPRNENLDNLLPYNWKPPESKA